MADPATTPPPHHHGRFVTLIESLAGAASLDVAATLLVKYFVERAAKKTAEHTADQATDVLLNDKRAELFQDIRIMAQAKGQTIAWGAKKDEVGKGADNLIRRYEAACDNLRKPQKKQKIGTTCDIDEYKFVHLLCKICKDPQLGRRPDLQWLNDIEEDDLFNHMLYMLDHDVVLQWMNKARKIGYRLHKKDLKKLEKLVAHASKRTASAAQEGWKVIDDNLAKAAVPLKGLADRLEARRKVVTP